VLYSVAGDRVDASPLTRDTPVHQLKAELSLRFETSGSATRMRVGLQEPPWKVIRAFRQPGGGALVHLHNVSGGVLAGDCLSLRIDVGSDATAQVTSTGATRIYRHRPGALPSSQHTNIFVGEGGLLEFLPDALIPFAESRHLQRSTVTLADKATFFWWEVIAPGRHAMGELFEFESLRIETSLRAPSRPLVLESFLLEPRLRPLQSPARLGRYLYIASFYAIQIGRTASAIGELEQQLNEVAAEISSPGDMIWGASALPSDGVVVRGLSTTARHLPATLVRLWSMARRFLTGENAIPPRKLN
jgi:urease accessory protein